MALAYYTPLQVNPAKVPSSQTDFTLLINITDARFKSVANGGHAQTAYDIRPYSDYGLTTALSYLLLRYNASTGNVIMRVKVPAFSAGMYVYLACGDVTLTTDGSNGPATFSNNFLGAYPLGDGTTLDVTSKTGSNNGTNSNAIASNAGLTDGAASFNGSNAQITCGTAMNPPAISISGWVYITSLAPAYQAPFMRNVSGSNAAVLIKSNGKLAWYIVTTSGGQISIDGTGIATLAINTWYHLALTYDSSQGFRCYVNGVLDASSAASGTMNTTAAQFTIGNDNITAGRFFNGLIQQVKVASVARTADWWVIEYNQGISPSTFLTVTPELPAGTSPFSVVSVNPACGSKLRSCNDFVVTFSDPIQVASLAAADFSVNGIPANSVTNTSTTATFHFNTSPITSGASQPMAIAGGAILRNSDGQGLLAFSCTLSYNPYTPNMLNVPTRNSLGTDIVQINSAVCGRFRRPQPFFQANLTNPELWGDFTMPDGTVGNGYLSEWYCENQKQPVVYSLLSGTLPTGTALSNVGSTARGRISGTPTAVGAFTFTLRASGPAASGDKTFTINISPSAGGGGGGVGGG